MFTHKAYEQVLGFKKDVKTTPKEMAKTFKVALYPKEGEVSENTLRFKTKLLSGLEAVGVEVISYDDAIEYMSIKRVLRRFVKVCLNNVAYVFSKLFRLPQNYYFISFEAIKFILKRKKIRKGVSIVVVGDQPTEGLPMQYIYGFKHNSIISLVDFPDDIKEGSSFSEHFETSMSMFAHHMTNLIIAVSPEKWMLYNFNASHPIFQIDSPDFNSHILEALVPKIAAPISPHKFSEFEFLGGFDVDSREYQNIIEDLVSGAKLFGETGLYPEGKRIDDMPFRNDFYRWIGKLHLDNRNGMSFGFLARQFPGDRAKIFTASEAENKFGGLFLASKEEGFFYNEKQLYAHLEMNGDLYLLEIPEVWILTQRSGSDKINVDKYKDTIRMGIRSGKMLYQVPKGVKLSNDIKPSFDTKVILAHSVGNAIIASILEYFDKENSFAKRFFKDGMSLSHWHGYFHPEFIPLGWQIHGIDKPHVACSSPQSAIYALEGKLESFIKSYYEGVDFKGDIHVEPHHGTNINFTSITELAHILIQEPQTTVLGNKYLYMYSK